MLRPQVAGVPQRHQWCVLNQCVRLCCTTWASGWSSLPIEASSPPHADFERLFRRKSGRKQLVRSGYRKLNFGSESLADKVHSLQCRVRPPWILQSGIRRLRDAKSLAQLPQGQCPIDPLGRPDPSQCVVFASIQPRHDDGRHLRKPLRRIGRYRQVMTGLGQELGPAVVPQLPSRDGVVLICTNEDDDFLARGLLETLKAANCQVSLACFWNDRVHLGWGEDRAPILRRYVEPMQRPTTFLVLKSIISGSCVIGTNISELVYTEQPTHIFVLSPCCSTEPSSGSSPSSRRMSQVGFTTSGSPKTTSRMTKVRSFLASAAWSITCSASEPPKTRTVLCPSWSESVGKSCGLDLRKCH